MSSFDAVVVGSGPNGLAAAIVLAQAGCSVLLREAAESVGGGTRSAPLTLPGFTHDVCSAVHPLAMASPFFRTLPLTEHGLRWIEPPVPLAHPFDDGSAALLMRSVVTTGNTLGRDAVSYRALMEQFVADWEQLCDDLLAPPHLPHHPLLLARFGFRALRSGQGLAKGHFKGERARALFAGLAAHAAVPLTWPGSAAIGLVLAAAGHAVGWPIAAGGSQALADALVSYFRSLGGEIVTGAPVGSLTDLPPTRVVLLDLTPRQVLRIAGDQLPRRYRRLLDRYRYGPGTYKVDWALAGPIPWKAPECALAATVHLGGGLQEIATAEGGPWEGQHAERPFVLLTQPSLFDSTRAPQGQHTAWAYCHVPNNSTFDMSDRIEAQVERFAPGFRKLILAKSVMRPRDLEHHNANLIGGDIGGGANTLGRLLFGPVLRRVPYSTPNRRLYICSSSTPPGGGVHGMCGYHAARATLKACL